MKKRILSAVLALVMVFALLPATARAEITKKEYKESTTLSYDWYNACKIIGSDDPDNPVVITINDAESDLKNSLSVSGSGTYPMTGGFTIVSGHVKITGGAYTANMYRVKTGGGWNYMGPMITVKEGATLTLEKVQLNGTSQSFTAVPALCAAIRNFGTLILGRGTTIANCTGSRSEEFGGAIYNASTGKLVMNDGAIAFCEAMELYYGVNYGGGIYNDHGSVEINGGSIDINCKAFSGGGIYMNGGTLVLNGGAIQGAATGGEGAYDALDAIDSPSLTVNGGCIAGTISSLPTNARTGTLGEGLQYYVYALDGTRSDYVHANTGDTLTVNDSAVVTSRESTTDPVYTGLYDENTKVWNFQIIPTGVTLDESSKSLDYPNNRSFTLTATVAPENAENQTLTWSSSNENVATVSGGTVTLQDTGSATITATTFNGLSASCALTVTASHVHSYTTASNESGHWTECSCGDRTASEAHTPVVDPAVAATCTETGKTEGSHCSFCNAVITAQAAVSAAGHSYGAPSYNWDGADCTAERVCTRSGCTHKETETVTAARQVTQARSCTLDEVSTYTASFSNAAFTQQTQTGVKTAEKLDHDYASEFTIDAPATCETAGSKSKHCSRCDSVAEVTAIPATGHKWGEWIPDGNGTETRTCANDASHQETQKSSYAITYAGMDGAAHGTNHPVRHTYGTPTPISDPSKPGYTFAGWQVNSGNWSKSLTLSGTAYTADITLTAHWTLNAPTVTLAADNASVTYGASVTLTATASHTLTTGVSYGYDWYKDGVSINHKAMTLTLSNVADSGSYTVKVKAMVVGETSTQASAQTESSAVSVTISPAAHDTPGVPVLAANGTTYNSITVTAISGQKYICLLAMETAPATAAGGWQDTGAFTKLSPNTAYKIYTYQPTADGNHTASAVSAALSVTTNRIKITSVTAPVNITLTDYCATGDEVKAKLPENAACVSEDGRGASLSIIWTAPTTYDAAPGAANSFTWSVSAPADYEFADSVTRSGSVAVTNKAATEVSITGADKEITYSGSAYDVKTMFTIPNTAGTASYSIVGGTGDGTLSGSELTIAEAGTINIKVTTAPSGNYAAGSAEATLTVNKGSVTVPDIIGKPYTGQVLTADVTGSEADNGYTVAKNDGGIGVGSYDVALTLNRPDLYQWSDGAADAEKKLTFTISQAANQWEAALACPGFTYDGIKTLAPAAQSKFGAVSFTYSTDSDGSYTSLPESGIKDAGTYYIKAGADGNTDYTGLTAGPVTVTIGKVKLTPAVATVTGRDYNGGTAAAGTISLTAASGYAMPANETPSASGTFTWTARNAGTATVNVGGIALTNASVNRNYELAAASLTNIPAPGEAKISPKALDIPARALAYNGTAAREVKGYATGVGSETITLTYALSAKDAGAYALGEDGKGFALTLSDTNYSLKLAGTLTIEPKPLTAPAKAVTYNGGTSFTQEVGGENGEKVAITYTAGSKNAAGYDFSTEAAAGKYTATADSANYTVTGGGALTIGPLEAALTWSGDGESTYDGSPRSVTAAVANKAAGDTVNVTVSGGAEKSARAAAYTATATGLTGGDAENYKLPSSKTTTYTINPKSISGATVTLGDALTYNGVEQAQAVAGVSIDGLDVSTFGVSDNKQTNAKSDYILTVTGAGNFTGTQTATWGIAQKPLTITAKPQTIIYGQSIATGTAQVVVSGLANGDALDSVVLTPNGSQVAGDKTIAPGAAVIKRGAAPVTGNYAIAFKTGTLTITNADMTPTVSGYADDYDGKAHGISVTMDGADIKYGTVSGTYDLDASPTYTDADEYTVYYQVTKANYTTVTGSATVKIIPKPIAAVWAGEDNSDSDFSWVYDGKPHAPAAAAATGVGGETVNLSVSGAATDYKESAYTATASIDPANSNYTLTGTTHDFSVTKADYDMSGVIFIDASAEYDGKAHSLTVTGTLPTGADGKPLTVRYSGSATNVSEGAVTVTAAFSTESANYNVPAAKTAKITVTPAALTVTAKAHSITYGDEPTGGGVSYSGFVTGESSANLGGTLGYDYDYVQYGDIGDGSYTLTPKGLTSTNYAIAFESGALTVSPRPITVTIADKSSVYGAQLETLTASVTEGSVVNSDSAYTLATTATPTSTVSDYSINGTATDSNYAVTFVGSDGTAGKYSITNAALTGVSVTGYSGAYDGQPHNADAGASATAVNGQAVTWRFGTSADACTQDHISVMNVSDGKTYYYEAAAPNHTTVAGSFTVTVSAKDISGAAVALGDALTYTGAEQRQEVTGVAIGGLAATYSVSNDTGTAASTYTLTVSGTGNFTGSQTKQFTIAPKPVALTWDYASPFIYDRGDKTVTATVSNQIEGDAFTLSYTNNRKSAAGSYTATVTGLGNGNYTLDGGTGKTLDWVIQKAPVSFAVSGDGYEYSNTARTATVAQTAGQLPTVGGGFNVSYKLPGEEISAAADSKTDAGVYDIIVTLSDDNFKFAGQADTVRSLKVGTLTIDKKPVTAQWKDLSHVYDGGVKSPVFEFADGDILPADVGPAKAGAVLSGDQSKSAAGSYTVRATLEGSRAHNYVLTNPTGSFVIQRAPVTFTVSDNSAQHDGSSHAATVTADIRAATFTVTYRDSFGNTVDAPTDVGVYDVCAAITDENYRHAGAADGGLRKVGVLTIYRYTAPAAYTVSFDGGAGAAGTTVPLAAAQAGTVRVLPGCGFAVTGSAFTGWKYGDSLYQPGERLTQPAANVTLTAQWAEDTYTIAGVVDQNNLPLADVVVTLMLGSKQIAQTSTTADGRYRFDDVLPGLYNLVASKNGVTQTVLAEIVAEDATERAITMPSGKTNSVVEVSAGSPAIVVGNLERSFASTEKSPCFDQGDADVVADGGTVEIKLTVSAASSTVTAIEDAASGTVGLYLDMTLTKTVTPAAGSATTETLTQSASLLEMVINLPGELQRKDAYAVYRVHEGVTGTLTSTPNENGEYIAVNAEKTAITVYAKYFSAYAVAFTAYPDDATSYKPVIAPTEHGSVTARPAEPTAGVKVTITLTPEEGYEPASCKVTDRNGKEVALTQNSDGTCSFTQPVGAVTITAHFRAVWNPFTDVKPGDWFHDDVRYVYENGLMQGTGHAAFSPRLATTRGMIVTILYRLEGEPAVTGACPFNDVPAGKYYEKAIIWAAANGIVEGYGNGKFGPDDDLTREQMAALLWRYAKCKGYDVTAGADLSKFTDEASISGYAKTALSWANANGLINGKGGGILDPGGSAERCQAAAVLQRFCENIVK